MIETALYFIAIFLVIKTINSIKYLKEKVHEINLVGKKIDRINNSFFMVRRRNYRLFFKINNKEYDWSESPLPLILIKKEVGIGNSDYLSLSKKYKELYMPFYYWLKLFFIYVIVILPIIKVIISLIRNF